MNIGREIASHTHTHTETSVNKGHSFRKKHSKNLLVSVKCGIKIAAQTVFQTNVTHF